VPRATFAGVEFDLLVQGLEDRHEGMTTVREIPGSAGAPGGDPVAYVDLGGATLHRRTVTVMLDNEAAYAQLAALPGTSGAQGTLTTDDGDDAVVLLSVARYYRRGGPLPQLCRTEWLFLPPGTTVTVSGGPAGRLPDAARTAPEAPA
jgi:hypothetical protein